jgi:hypothetical protein
VTGTLGFLSTVLPAPVTAHVSIACVFMIAFSFLHVFSLLEVIRYSVLMMFQALQRKLAFPSLLRRNVSQDPGSKSGGKVRSGI